METILQEVKQKKEVKIEIEPETVLPSMCRAEQIFLKGYEYVQKVKQEEEVNTKYEDYNMEDKTQLEIKPEIIIPMYQTLQDVKKFEYVEVKQEYGSDEIYDDTVNESNEEDQNETNFEKCDNPTKTQIEEESLKDEDGFLPGKRKNENLRKIESKPLYYECKRCSKKFPDFKGLKKHRKVKHPLKGDNPTSCPICNKMVRKRLMNRHMKMHTGEKLYCCEICGDIFSAFCGLNKHKRNRHLEPNNRMHPCQTCQKSYKSLDSLKDHQKIHTKKNADLTTVQPYECHICENKFKTLKTLKNHKLIHTGEKQNVCSVCSKAFTQPASLKYHMRIHTGEKPYTCETCSKTFAEPNNLKKHARLHTGEKPYNCAVCNKAFTQRSHLKSHMNIHTGEKSYTCKVW